MKQYLSYITGIIVMVAISEYQHSKLMNSYKKMDQDRAEAQKAILRLNKIKNYKLKISLTILFFFLWYGQASASTITAAVATSTDANAWTAGTTWQG